MDPHLTWLLTHIHKFSLSPCEWSAVSFSGADWLSGAFSCSLCHSCCYSVGTHTEIDTHHLKLLASVHHWHHLFILIPVIVVQLFMSFHSHSLSDGLIFTIGSKNTPVPLPSQLTGLSGLSGFWIQSIDDAWDFCLFGWRLSVLSVHLRNLPELHSPCDKWHIVIDFKKINRQISVNLYSCQIKIDHEGTSTHQNVWLDMD